MSARLWLAGAGNMGGAMLRGWLSSGISPADVVVIDPVARNLPVGVTHHTGFPRKDSPDVLVLAVKPQQLAALSEVYQRHMAAPRLLLSVLAGVEIATLAAGFGAAHVVRAMPNLPAAIGQGATVLHTSTDDAGLRAEAGKLMAPLGIVEWIEDESLFDAVTALSGSGPGFVFRFIEALAEAGARLGLPAELADRLAIATVRGAAVMAEQGTETLAVLADRVASPGGTTRAGLDVLDDDDALKLLINRTLEAASRRSAELAAASRD